MSSALVVLSGGLDSTTALAHTATHGYQKLYAISFDYGQRHSKELMYAKQQAHNYDVMEHKVVDLHELSDLFASSGSSLVTGNDVPEGHYGEESMKSTVVPNRNMIMGSIAAGYAISVGADVLVMGVHAGDHYIYPDCRPAFFRAFQWAVNVGNDSFHPPLIETPFIEWSKNQIAQRAFDLHVDIADTWSCYKGGDRHCGRCGTCVERLEAIASTGNADPTVYEDDQFWREALKRGTV